MAKITFYPDRKTIETDKDITILEAARLAGVVIESPCGGMLTCGKCKVRVDSESFKNIELSGSHQLNEEERANGYVLACGARIKGDVNVELPLKAKNSTTKILKQGKNFNVSKEPFITKVYDKEKDQTKVFSGKDIIGNEEGDTSSKAYGIVVDIGTTTLVTSLVDIISGTNIDDVSALNPQTVYAQDVLSRIKFASEHEGLETMRRTIIDEINSMISKVSRKNFIDTKNIYEIVLSGNTCMLHLAAGVNPYSLGKYPYQPVLWGGEYLKARDAGIKIADFGNVYMPPIISAYVGADITSGILASELDKLKGVTLFVDIGTNGEMAISYEGRLSVSSTAAGPAFEGMNISYGMRAAEGAIEYFSIGENDEIEVRTIGNAEPAGICGSGLIDIAGELVKHGIIGKNGKFVSPDSEKADEKLRQNLVKTDNEIKYKVSGEVYLTQKDIRQIQLAKGAVRAGIEFLMRDKGVEASEVERVYIAGSFGYHLRAESLINIGLLPEEFRGKIEFLGNTSSSGGYGLLINKDCRDKMKRIVKEIDVIELSKYKDFDRVFVECLKF